MNEQTSEEVKAIAAKGLKNPDSLTREEIQKVCASALTQAPDKPQTDKAFETSCDICGISGAHREDCPNLK